jgi:hypothetical protein
MGRSVRCQWSVVRCGKTQNSGMGFEARRARREVGRDGRRQQTTEDRGQETEVREQRSEIGGQTTEGGLRISDCGMRVFVKIVEGLEGKPFD